MSISTLLAGDDDATAIRSPDGPAISYAALRDRLDATRERLTKLGLGPGNRIAVVMPGGAALAVMLLAVADTCAVAPLNPAYRSTELEFYLSDLRADAVLTTEASAMDAARACGLPVLHVSDTEAIEPAGDVRPRLQSDSANALLLHTSGTTSRPKLVALTRDNLAAGAANVAHTLQLGPRDRLLGIMPLFHIHGIATLLTTLSTGGTVIATEGFSAFRLFRWLADERPTWISAVPSMYHAILARSGAHHDALLDHSLRVLRSASSSLPPALMRRLEAAFGIPALEAMGMTEAAHQVASNPLPPAERRPGSVGKAAGPEVAVAENGEVVLRGPNVMSGYVNNDEANAEAFADGWFRTGDIGTVDASGYLTLIGRIKEMINRGGEKIGPREVEDVLLEHAAVSEAVAFPVPHRTLGEDVAAAVVLAADASTDELRGFVRERLAAFKVPRTIVVVDRIPTGPTGKPQRLTLARRLGLSADDRTPA